MQEDSDSHSDLFNKLQAALKEVENLKREAFEESCKYRKAETQLMLSRQKVIPSIAHIICEILVGMNDDRSQPLRSFQQICSIFFVKNK